MIPPDNMPMVSILIPCHNAERWIEAAVKSALAQTWAHKEIIVVDDGSRDGSPEILKSFGDSIRYEFKRQEGPNHTRNRLLNLARGEWLQYLDADDCLLPHKIEHQLEEVARFETMTGQARQIDVVYSPVLIERWIDGIPQAHQATIIDPSIDLFSQWFLWQMPQTGGPLWRKSAVIAAGTWREAPPGEVPCCEHDLYARAMRAGMRFHYFPEAAAVYRIWSSSTLCHQSPVKIIQTKNKLFDVMIDWMKDTGLWREEHRRAAGQSCFRMARSWAAEDLPAAAAFYRQRKSEGLMRPIAAAAPAFYRLLLKLFGFSFAESFASAKRRITTTFKNTLTSSH